MRLKINPVIIFEPNEVRLLQEALRPYRVHPDHLMYEGFAKCINRASGEMTSNNLLEAHRSLLDLQVALRRDGDHWRREASEAPEEHGGIILRPKDSFRMLSDIRGRQADLCGQALDIVRRSMGVLKDLEQECRVLRDRAQDQWDRS